MQTTFYSKTDIDLPDGFESLDALKAPEKGDWFYNLETHKVCKAQKRYKRCHLSLRKLESEVLPLTEWITPTVGIIERLGYGANYCIPAIFNRPGHAKIGTESDDRKSFLIHIRKLNSFVSIGGKIYGSCKIEVPFDF